MKGFVEERGQSSNHCNSGEERVASRRILHFKSNGRVRVKGRSSGDLCGAQAFKPVFRRGDVVITGRRADSLLGSANPNLVSWCALTGKLFHHQGGVVPAETERVIQSYTHLFFPGSVRGEIEITFFIGMIEVDGGGNHAIAYGQRTHRHLDCSSSAQQMASHRFGRTN